jgi:hypothetical protein
MASTRNRNTQGDFKQEQKAYADQFAYYDYNQSTHFAHPTTSYFSGNGLIGMKCAGSILSNNACDIESQLFGIGSTNLVEPRPIVSPDIKHMQSLNICDRLPQIAVSDFKPEPNQRPMWRN